jgi:hypothetical protein
MLLRIVLIGSVSFGLLACDPLKNEKDSKDSDDVQATRYATPINYKLEDAGCFSENKSLKLGSYKINQFVDGKSTLVDYQFQNASSNTTADKSVVSDLILGTAWGYHSRTEQSCTLNSDNGVESCGKESEAKKISDARYLRLCRESGSYVPGSIEGVTLSTLANLEVAHKAYEILDEAKTLGKAWLFMLPNYEEVFHLTNPEKKWDAIGSKTDNAGFANTDEDDNIYVIYPKSKEEQEKPEWAEVNLWEVPWVMAHEFSHHVFSSHYSYYKQDRKRGDNGPLAKAHIWGFEKRPDFHTGGMNLVSTREVLWGDGIAAINEGFADLLGFYLLGQDKPLTAGVPCMDVSRSIHSATFGGGSDKILTTALLEEFDAKSAAKRPESCEKLFIQDVHAMGAIFAHQLNVLFSTTFTEETTNKEKASVALRWINEMDKIRSTISNDTGAQGALWLGLHAAANVLKVEEKVSEENCEILIKGFPAFTDKIKEHKICE